MFVNTLPGGREVKTSFGHTQKFQIVYLGEDCSKERYVRGWTDCYLIVKNKVFTGRAYCSIDDQFNKGTGRTLALTRALKNALLPREDRVLIWNSYWKMVDPSRMTQPF